MKTESTMKYKIYEDNGGGVHFALLENDRLVYLSIHLEMLLNYKYVGHEISDMIDALDEDKNAWKYWDAYDDEPPMQDCYKEISETDDLIAWGTVGNPADHEIYTAHIGDNARDLLGISDEEI